MSLIIVWVKRLELSEQSTVNSLYKINWNYNKNNIILF